MLHSLKLFTKCGTLLKVLLKEKKCSIFCAHIQDHIRLIQTIPQSHETKVNVEQPHSDEHYSLPKSNGKLSEILKIQRTDALTIKAQYPKLNKLLMVDLKSRMECYSNEGVNISTIIKYPWLLLLDPIEINTKLKIIKPLPCDINSSVTLLCQKNRSYFNKSARLLLAELSNDTNRVKYLSEKLETAESEIFYAIGRYPFLMQIQFKRIQDISQFLLDVGVHPENILGDFWIFKYRLSTIKTRLQYARDANVTSLKTWMVRCKLNIYNRTLERHNENKTALGNLSSIQEYLSERLDLDLQYTHLITEKHPEIKRMNVKKAKEVIDYLLSEGYTEKHVIRCPRILCCKLQTIRIRQQTFKKIDVTPLSLVIFCKSQHQYEQYLKRLCKRKKIKMSSLKITE